MDMIEMTRMAVDTAKNNDIKAASTNNLAMENSNMSASFPEEAMGGLGEYPSSFKKKDITPPNVMMMNQLPRKKVSASVLVQIFLYYNVFFSLTFAFLEGVIIADKMINYVYHSGLQRGSTLPVFLMWLVVEPLRLLLGYIGNLQERVPQMSAFLLMTIFPQIPCLVFLALFQEHIFPYDRVAGYILLSSMIIEVIVGFRSLRKLIRKSTAEFYRMCQNVDPSSASADNPSINVGYNHSKDFHAQQQSSTPGLFHRRSLTGRYAPLVNNED